MPRKPNPRAFAFLVNALTARAEAKARGEDVTPTGTSPGPVDLSALETELTDAIQADVRQLFSLMDTAIHLPLGLQAKAIGSDDYMDRRALKKFWRDKAAALRPTLDQVLSKVAQVAKANFTAHVRAIIGVDIITDNPGVEKALAERGRECAGYIKDIGSTAIDRVAAVVKDGVQRGVSSRKIKQSIQEELGIASRRAELIATDQINKLNGSLTAIRHQSLGINKYRWRGAMDNRERPTHVAREGQVFAYDNPPSDGNPGEPVRCRCYADPVMDEFEGIF